jgi:5-methylcytosine-specific restriction protein A
MPTLPAIHDSSTGAEKHSTEAQDSKKRQAGRQFRTNSTHWRRLRARQLMLEPLCRECRKKGLIKSGNEVDHIDGDSFNNSADNLQTLCKPCHSSKTAKENGGFGRN